MVVTSGDSAIELVAKPNTSTLPMIAQRRPNLSANSPANALPIPMPTRPAATAGANALRVMPHSLIKLGMANPMKLPIEAIHHDRKRGEQDDRSLERRERSVIEGTADVYGRLR